MEQTRAALSAEREQELQLFCKQLGISFTNLSLLDRAFHHRSFSNETNDVFYNNETLEFLGDTVLAMATATYLYKTMPDKTEGELAKTKSVVVSEMTLSAIALAIGIDRCLVLGHGEERSGGRQKKAILADAVEAVIGAYYLDSGYAQAEKLILSLIVDEIQKVKQNRHIPDYKTILQEYYQKKRKSCPVYKLVEKSGPEHDITFWMTVSLDDKTYGPAQGKNKKTAEQAAARIACESLALADSLTDAPKIY